MCGLRRFCVYATRDRDSALAAGAEREDRVLFRGDGRAILRGGLEAPILQCCKALAIDIRAKALQHGLADDFAALVDGDFDDLVTRGVRQLPWINTGIGRRDWQRGPNLV